METAIELYFNNLCECEGCTTFQINTQCLIINSNHLIIN